MHNGLIDGFYSIKIKIIQMIHPDSYQNVLGQTDSEHVFALILFFLAKSSGPLTANAYKKAIEKAIKKILSWLKDAQQLLVLNFVISNGHSLIAIRYSNHPERKKLTLYYTNHVELSAANPQAQSVIIASEKLSDVEKNWHSVPMNHFLYVGSDFKPIMKALSI